MPSIVRVGVDLAKNVIQVHAVDAGGRRVVAKAFNAICSVPGANNCQRVVWRP